MGEWIIIGLIVLVVMRIIGRDSDGSLIKIEWCRCCKCKKDGRNV